MRSILLVILFLSMLITSAHSLTVDEAERSIRRLDIQLKTVQLGIHTFEASLKEIQTKLERRDGDEDELRIQYAMEEYQLDNLYTHRQELLQEKKIYQDALEDFFGHKKDHQQKQK